MPILYTWILQIIILIKKAVGMRTNWEELYAAANTYYDAGEYNKAIILYDKVLPVIRGSERAELADFNYAYSHYRTKRYIECV